MGADRAKSALQPVQIRQTGNPGDSAIVRELPHRPAPPGPIRCGDLRRFHVPIGDPQAMAREGEVLGISKRLPARGIRIDQRLNAELVANAVEPYADPKPQLVGAQVGKRALNVERGEQIAPAQRPDPRKKKLGLGQSVPPYDRWGTSAPDESPVVRADADTLGASPSVVAPVVRIGTAAPGPNRTIPPCPPAGLHKGEPDTRAGNAPPNDLALKAGYIHAEPPGGLVERLRSVARRPYQRPYQHREQHTPSHAGRVAP